MSFPANPHPGTIADAFNRKYIFSQPIAAGPGTWRVAVSQSVGEGETVVPPSFVFSADEPVESTTSLTDINSNTFSVKTSLDIESLDEKS